MKVVQEYERAVIFRLGRLRQGGAKVHIVVDNNNQKVNKKSIHTVYLDLAFQGPGIFFVIPCIDHFKCVDLRTVSFDVPPQEVSRMPASLFSEDKLELSPPAFNGFLFQESVFFRIIFLNFLWNPYQVLFLIGIINFTAGK